MKITFKNNTKDLPRETLFISVGAKNEDEVIKESGVKTLYLKCDKTEKMSLRKLFLLVRKMVIMGKSAKVEKIAFNFDDFKFRNFKLTDTELGEIIGSQLDFANYEFNKYKTPPKEGFPLIKEIFILGASKETQKAILKGNIVADEVNKTRSLSNMPGGDMTPSILAAKAKEAVKGLPVVVTVLG